MKRNMRLALYRKVAGLPEWRQFQADFFAVTGLRVELVDELGLAEGCSVGGNSTLCGRMAGDVAGRQTCQRFRQRILGGITDGGQAEAECDAGLREKALALRAGGVEVGFLVVAGYRIGELTSGARSRARHLLRKAGVMWSREELEPLLAAAPDFSGARWGAFGRWLELAAREIEGKLVRQVTTLAEEVPEAVGKAVRCIRARAFGEEVSLPQVARTCGVSAGHLSRLFVRATGSSFTEFVSRLRIERARELLLTTTKPVTEIAFASGFSSLSQFHRVFRRVEGCSPRELRQKLTSGMSGA
jgi:AraC-like DNA-binding protein